MTISLVDSHCHLDRLDLAKHDDLDQVMAEAKEQGIDHILCVAINMGNIPAVIALAEKYHNVTASVGVHPNDHEENEPSTEELIKLADHPKVVAIGETGLDYFRSEGDLSWQHDRFKRHIAAAKATNKPLIIHTREAKEDTLKFMQQEGADQVGGVMHCFVEDLETAQRAIEMGFYISFSGIVTFKNSESLREVAKTIPMERILVETDSPYLAPMPKRGRPNFPAYTRYVAEKIAEVRGITVGEVAERTTENFYRLFSGAVG